MKALTNSGQIARLFLTGMLAILLAACVTITTQPQSLTVAAGQTATFSVAATSSTGTTLTYQWYRNGSAIAGATSASYSLVAGTADSGATFYVVVNDNSSPVQSSTATLTVTAPALASLSLLAGSAGGPGSFDGTGSAARFFSPLGVVVDSSGNSYVADNLNGTIRKVTPAGVVTTLAGSPGSIGHTDGTGAGANFYGPIGMTIDSAGNLYVVDGSLEGTTSLRKVTSAGVVTTLTSFAGGVRGVAVDSSGNLYATDATEHVIYKVTSTGTVSTLAGTAGKICEDTGTYCDGTGAAAIFRAPSGITIDASGNLYIVDAATAGMSAAIRKITPAGVVSTINGGSCCGDLSPFTGIAINSSGVLYIANYGLTTMDSATGNVTGSIGAARNGYANADGIPYANFQNEADGTTATAVFLDAAGVAIDPSTGNLVVTDYTGNTLRRVALGTGSVTTIAGLAATTGDSTTAYFASPQGIASDSAGNVYVADTNNYAIRKVTPAGVVSTPVDFGLSGLNTFLQPQFVAVDSAGNYYIYTAEGLAVDKISGGVDTGITTGVSYGGGGGMALDSAGNIYVSDYNENIINKITPAGVITTIAGTSGTIGTTNGTGAQASFAQPTGLAVDSSGNVYVADNRTEIRKITPAGVVTTLTTSIAAAGFVHELAVDSAGNVYATVSGSLYASANAWGIDSPCNEVRKITPAGVITTVSGYCSGIIGIGLGSQSSLVEPYGLTVLPDGNLAIGSADAVLKTSGL